MVLGNERTTTKFGPPTPQTDQTKKTAQIWGGGWGGGVHVPKFLFGLFSFLSFLANFHDWPSGHPVRAAVCPLTTPFLFCLVSVLPLSPGDLLSC